MRQFDKAAVCWYKTVTLSACRIGKYWVISLVNGSHEMRVSGFSNNENGILSIQLAQCQVWISNCTPL